MTKRERRKAKNRRNIKKYWANMYRQYIKEAQECFERADELARENYNYGAEFWEADGYKAQRQADEAWRRYMVA